MKALIFSGGKFSGLPKEIVPASYDIIICADSGYAYAKSLGLIPDVVVGDFDSFPKEDVVAKKVITLNPIKDATDTQCAIDEAIHLGARSITILGALGKRYDHALSNIHLLKYAHQKGASAEISDIDTHISLVTDSATFLKKDGLCFSLIPLTDCRGVSVSGAFYPLDNACMPVGLPFGVSNEFVSDEVSVSVSSGELLVILSKS